MEDYRDNLVVIFAGYTKEMQDFIDSNSGIASRIGYTLEFEDYTNDELKDHRYIYHLGDPSFRPVDRFIDRMIRENRILYQDNSCGTMFWNHVGMKGRR